MWANNKCVAVTTPTSTRAVRHAGGFCRTGQIITSSKICGPCAWSINVRSGYSGEYAKRKTSGVAWAGYTRALAAAYDRSGEAHSDDIEENTKSSGDVLRWREVMDLLGKDWKVFAQCVVANLVSVTAYVLVAPCLGNVIDVISATDKSTLVDLGKAVGALGAAYLLSNVALAAQVSLATTAGERLASRVRTRLFSAMLRRDGKFYSKISTGTMLSWLGNDVEVLQTTISKLLGARGIRAVLETIGIIAILLHLNWLLALTLLFSAPLLTPLVISVSSRIRKASEEVQEATGQTSSAANEIIENQKIIKVHQSEEQQTKRFADLVDKQSHANNSLIKFQALLDVSSRLRNVLCVLITVGLGAHLALMNQVTVGTCYSFFIYSFGFSFALSNVTQSLGEISKVIGTMKRVSSILAMVEEKPNSSGIEQNGVLNDTRTISNLRGTIEFRNVCFTHPGQGWSMRDISFVMPANTTTALVGPSGGGKSTIASLLLGLYKPTSGDIFVDGISLKYLNQSWWKEQIGMVEQQPGLLVGKVKEVLSYGNTNASYEDIERVLIDTQAIDFVHNLPDEMETTIGADGIELSGGQAQRIALARALLRKPKILVLDEATSALDVNTEFAVTDALIRRRHGDESPTTLVIAHRLSTVRNADNIIVIDDGKVVESGTHADLVADENNSNGFYSRLYRLLDDNQNGEGLGVEATDLTCQAN